MILKRFYGYRPKICLVNGRWEIVNAYAWGSLYLTREELARLTKAAIFCDKRNTGTLMQYFCHAHKDGDCTWEGCPQLRDNEPDTTGRHCPLDTYPED